MKVRGVNKGVAVTKALSKVWESLFDIGNSRWSQ